MKKLLKGLISVLGVITLLIIVIAIVTPSDNSKDDITSTASDGEKPSMSKKSQKYEVRVMDYFLSKDYEGKDVLVVDYEWTNNSDESTQFWLTLDDKVFQNGIELNDSVYGCDDTNIDDQMTEIQPGAVFRVKCDYYLRDTTSPINIIVEEGIGNAQLLDMTLELK